MKNEKAALGGLSKMALLALYTLASFIFCKFLPSLCSTCKSNTDNTCNALLRNTEAALQRTRAKKLVLAGGVSANSVLRERVGILAKRYGAQLYLPALSLCGDNAAMVGAQGYYEYLAGRRGDMSLNAAATMPIEENGR